MAQILITGGSSEFAKITGQALVNMGHSVTYTQRNPDLPNYFDLADDFDSLKLTFFNLIIHFAFDRKNLNSKNNSINQAGTLRLFKKSILFPNLNFVYISSESVNYTASNYSYVKKDTEVLLRPYPSLILRVGTIINAPKDLGVIKVLTRFPIKVGNFLFIPKFMIKNSIFKITVWEEFILKIHYFAGLKAKINTGQVISITEPTKYSIGDIVKINAKNPKFRFVPLFVNLKVILFFNKFLPNRYSSLIDSMKIFRSKKLEGE